MEARGTGSRSLRVSAIFERIAGLLPAIAYEATPPDFQTAFVASPVLRQLGFSDDEFIGDTWLRHVHDDDRPRVERDLADALASREDFSIRYRFWNKARTDVFWFADRGVIERDAAGVPVRISGAMVDITESQKLVRSLEASELRYRDLFNGNPLPVWVYDLETLRFLLVNDAAVAAYGWTREEFHSMTLLDIRPPEDHARLRAEVERHPLGMHDAGIWRHLHKDGAARDVHIVSHSMTYDGRPAELVLAQDITEWLASQRRADSAESGLRKALVNTVRVLVAAVEKRDPFTAGHQRRVSRLAGEIARRLRLPDEQVTGIEFGGMVHDIGKISIPAEVLVMPRRLNDVEMAMVREHPVTGWELMKDTQFPWPIAEVVLQHHERLDGSGYPYGLTGDAIRLESRIVAVADVVAAMTAHRPWRARRSLEETLVEIRTGRGRLYDPFAVDVCLAIAEEGRLEEVLDGA